MSTLQRLQCDGCGGLIDRETLTCRSCGLQYRYDHEMNTFRIITQRGKTELLHGRILIDDEDLHRYGEQVIEHSIRKIATSMAQQLIPYMEWERESDPTRMQTAIYARVRVAVPEKGDLHDVL